MAILSGGHPRSPSGRAQITSDLLRCWSWYFSTSSLSSRTSQLVAVIRYEDGGPRAVKRVFAVALVMYFTSGSHGPFLAALNGYASSWRTSSMGRLVDNTRRRDRLLSLCGFLFTLSLKVLMRSWTATKESDGPRLVGALVSGGQCAGEVEVTGITFPPLSLTC